MTQTLGRAPGGRLIVLSALGIAIAAIVWAPAATGERAALVQAIYSIRASLLFTTAALVCWPFSDQRSWALEYWRLLKTAGGTMYLVHFYFTFVLLYGASLDAVYRDQGVLIASSNLLLTLVWPLEIVITTWKGEPATGAGRAAQAATYTFVATSFVVAAVFLRGGASRVLGIACIVAVILAWTARGGLAPQRG